MKEIKRIPYATLLLIALNIGVAFASALGWDVEGALGFRPSSPTFLQAFSCLVAHDSVIHLAGNMLFLAAVGPAVEFATGVGRFLTVYWLSGVAGVLLHWVFAMNAVAAPPLVGASACIAGCAAFYTVRFFNLRVPILPNFSLPIWSIASVWFVLQGVGSLVRFTGSQGGTSYWAHLGGFALGLALSIFYKAPKDAELHFGHDVLDRMNDRGPAAVVHAAQAHLKTHPNDIKGWWTLAEAQRNLGETHEEIITLTHILSLEDDGRQSNALSRLGELSALTQVSSHRRTRMAAQVLSSQPDLARTLLESVVGEPDSEPQKPDAMFALLELNWDANPGSAKALIAELYERFPLHPAADRARARGWQP